MGSFLGLAWLGIGILAAVYVARGAQPVEDSRWHETLRRLLEPGGQRRPIDVRQSASLSVPMAWGLRRPVILVPAASATWSDEAKRSVLLHELGHIRRGDCLAHLVGRLACAVYWFHPLVWLASRALRKTAERAADDLVLSSNVAAPDYAEHLVGIAAQLRGISLFGHAALPMAGASDLEGRVLALLDEKRNHRSLKRSSCYALLISATFFLVPCALLRLGHAQSKESQEPTSSVAETPSANDPRSPGKGGSGTKAEKPQKREKEVPPPPPRANATSRAATSPPAPVKTLLVSGVVVDENGKPAAGVSVRAFAQGQREPVV
jgi:beta-lactamase regulating signal transducer with metallopeptidase domain